MEFIYFIIFFFFCTKRIDIFPGTFKSPFELDCGTARVRLLFRARCNNNIKIIL
jgi:hypothetical protein